MKKQAHVYKVEVEKDGSLHQATYTIESGIMKVSYGMTSNSTQVGATPHNVLAEVLLHEILCGNAWKG